MPKGIGKTDTGRVREHNEDAFYVDDALGFYVVADGMGGARGGEVASRLAITVMAEMLAGARDQIAAFASDPRGADAIVALLREAFAKANGRILGEARTNTELRGMGCTMTAMVVGEGAAVVAHVGDSRAYVREEGVLRQVTGDHTLAAEMVRAGAPTANFGHGHPFTHILTRAVGTKDEVEVETQVIDLTEVDAVLLCSDGLTDHAEDTGWLMARMADSDIDSVPDALIAHANDAGGEDNITVVVVATPPPNRISRRGLLGRIEGYLSGREKPE